MAGEPLHWKLVCYDGANNPKLLGGCKISVSEAKVTDLQNGTYTVEWTHTKVPRRRRRRRRCCCRRRRRTRMRSAVEGGGWGPGVTKAKRVCAGCRVAGSRRPRSCEGAGLPASRQRPGTAAAAGPSRVPTRRGDAVRVSPLPPRPLCWEPERAWAPEKAGIRRLRLKLAVCGSSEAVAAVLEGRLRRGQGVG